MPALHCVVLFDIDGTLVTGPGPGPSPGVRAMGASARSVTGFDGLPRRVEFAGRTDRQIARDLLLAAGVSNPTDEKLDRLLARYAEALERNVIQHPYRALGDIPGAVHSLRAEGAIVGLGTGNIRRGARAKLQSAGLADLFDFDLGGFGDDAEARNEVLAAGARRCDPSGTRRVIVVGDTPHDVRAAQAIGARCVAVPTGLFDESALRACDPDLVVSRIDPAITELARGLLEGS